MNDISMVRGDTKIIAVDLTDSSGVAYVPAAGDSLTLTIRSTSMELVLSKTTGDADVEVVSGSWQVTLQPADTDALDYGLYLFDIEVTLADGYRQTVIPAAYLTLTQEVTYVEV